MAAGAGELHAWAVHGAAAAERARRVLTAVHAARERAQRALAVANTNTGSGSLSVGGWPARVPVHSDPARGALLEARAQLAAHRAAAREKLARAEAEAVQQARAEEAIRAAKRAERARAEASQAELAAAQAAREKSAEEARKRALEAIQARERAKQAEEAKRIHEEEQRRLKTIEDKKKKETEACAQTAAQNAMNANVNPQTNNTNANKTAYLHTSPKADSQPPSAKKARQVLHDFEARSASFGQSTSAEVKRTRQRIKRGIVKACNQISASKTQVRRCASALHAAIMDGAALGAEPGAWAFALAARRLVDAGEDAGTGGPKARFAWAYTAAGVVLRLPSFGQVLYGALVDSTPAVAALPTPRLKTEDNEVYRKRVSAREGEGADAYASRSAKTVALFAALCQTCSGKGGIGVHLLWAWLARVVNVKPHPMAPICVVAMLETAGHAMTKAYFKQFAKLMATVQQRVYKNPHKNSPPGPLVNLEQLIATFIQGPHNFQFHQPPQGIELPEIDQSLNYI